MTAQLRLRAQLSEDQARWFGENLAGNDISDAQAGAFAMGVCLNGLSTKARVALTEGMRDSGDVLSWDLPGPVIDKHSTGGVGDPVSLLLAPALAAAGAYVPMISGRGLGHTGGTLDKLEAIPGFRCDISSTRLARVVKKCGVAIAAASRSVAPSDKRLYAIRDVTGTVASVDLITASILSKKLAAGLDALVLDVKTGSGAFMESRKDAENLAKSLVAVANGAGCKSSALITDMSQPLANAAGNAVELRAVMATLTGENVNQRLLDVCIALGTELLVSSGLSKTDTAAAKLLNDLFASGKAADKFEQMVDLMGGPPNFASNWQNVLPEATVLREVKPTKKGHVTAIDTRALGEAVVALGGGRLRESDLIDHAVGLSDLAAIGQPVDQNTPLAMVHASSEEAADQACKVVLKAYDIASKKPDIVNPVISSVS